MILEQLRRRLEEGHDRQPLQRRYCRQQRPLETNHLPALRRQPIPAPRRKEGRPRQHWRCRSLVGGPDPGPARGCPCQPLPSKDLQLQARLPALRPYPKQLLRAIHPRGQMVTTSIAGEVLVAVRPRGTRFELIILDLSDQMYFVK